MTRKLYYENSHLVSFEATVLSCQPHDTGYQIILDATAFFPEGGGQGSDTGILACPDGSLVQVVHVTEKNDIISHAVNQPVKEGTVVTGTIDWEKRFDRMQQHSGEHIISGLVHKKYGFDNVGFHLGDQDVTLDFNGVLTKDDFREIELAANKAIAANFPVKILYPSKEELATMSYRSKIEILGQVRIVEYPDYDVCACCAPHVDQTGEIGMIKVTHVQNHRGGIRVNILCGLRALQDYREKEENIKKISVLLSAKESLTSDAVMRLKEELFATQGRLIALQEQLLNQELQKLPSDAKDVICFFDDLEVNAVREFINQAMKRCAGYCAAFLGSDQTGYKYIIGSSTEDVRPLGKAFHAILNGRGGGKPEMIQGSVNATQTEIKRALSR